MFFIKFTKFHQTRPLKCFICASLRQCSTYVFHVTASLNKYSTLECSKCRRKFVCLHGPSIWTYHFLTFRSLLLWTLDIHWHTHLSTLLFISMMFSSLKSTTSTQLERARTLPKGVGSLCGIQASWGKMHSSSPRFTDPPRGGSHLSSEMFSRLEISQLLAIEQPQACSSDNSHSWEVYFGWNKFNKVFRSLAHPEAHLLFSADAWNDPQHEYWSFL